MIRYNLVLILLGDLLFSVASHAAVIKGTVFEKGVKFPLRESSVIVMPQKIRATTDDAGAFSVEVPDEAIKPESGTKLIIQKSGYDKYEGEIKADEGARYFLNRVSSLDYETTIISQEKKDPSLRKIRARDAVMMPGAAQDAIKAIQNLPGVNRTPGFSSQVIVQGSSPEETLYSIDTHEVPIMFHFGGLGSVVMPELLGDIDFYTAGYQTPFGRALGGIINANTVSELPRTDANQFSRGMAYFDIFNVGGAYSTPIGKESHLSFGARASYVGAILKQIANKSDELNLTVAPSFNDVAAVFESRLNERLKFKLTSILSRDTAEFVVKEAFGNDPALRGDFSNMIQFFRFIPQLEWTHSVRSKSRFSFGLGQDKIENILGTNYFYLKSNAMSTRGENETQVTPTWSHSIGYDHRYSWSDVTFTLPQIYASGGVINPISTGEVKTGDLNSVKSHKIGLYSHHRWKPSLDSRWTLFPGLRIDYFNLVRDVEWSPRFSARYQWKPDLAFTLASGRYAQAPAEQFASPKFGNPGIKSTHSYHLSLRGEKDFSAEWSRGSNAMSGVFAKWMDSLIIPDRETIYANKGNGRAFGWENSINYRFDPFSIYGAYTLSRSTRWDPSQAEYLSRYDQTHFLTLIGAVDLPKNWRISARFRYVTGALTTPITGGIFDADNDTHIPIRGASFSQRLKDFNALDLRADKRWVYDTWVLSLYVDIQNALNRVNSESVQYSYDYRSKVDVAGLPIIPTIGLKGEF